MKIMTTYIADDGKAFEDEEECYEYEKNLEMQKYLGKIYFYDCEHKPMTFQEARTYNEHVYYILVNDIVGIELLKEWSKEGISCDVGNPFDFYQESCGLYYWDDEISNWRSWQEEVDKLKEIGSYFQLFEEDE